MRKKDIRSLVITLIPISVIWAGLAYLAINNARYWIGFIAVLLLALTIRNQIAYYRKNEPEIVDADRNSQKGLWKIAFGLTTIYAIIATTLYMNGHTQNYITWFAWVIPIFLFGYIFVRMRKFRKNARQKIEERKTQGTDS